MLTPQEIFKNFQEAFLPDGDVKRLIAELETERGSLLDELRLDLFSLKEICYEEGVETKEGVQASKLIMLGGCVERLGAIDKHLARLKRLQRAAKGEKPKPGTITDEMIQTARDVPCESLLPGAEFRQVGSTLKACCPFHDDRHPSFTVNPERNIWKCWSQCGGGDSVDLYMRLNGVGFREAVHALSGVNS